MVSNNWGSEFGVVRKELERAEAKFPPFRSPHEGLAIIQEEFEEFKNEVFWGSKERQLEEAIQLAAMAIRYIKDCT